MNKHMKNAKEIQTLLSPGRMRVMIVPLSEALGLLPLPLPEEIVTADVSPCGNEGAWESDVGGGWASKNARCGKRGSVMISRSGKLEGIYVWGLTDPEGV